MTHIQNLLIFAMTTPTVVMANGIPQEVDAAFAEYTALPDRLVPILDQARSKESATAQADALFKELPRIFDAKDRLEKIPALTPAVKKQVVAKYEKEMRNKWGKVYEHIFRLQDAKCYGSLPFFKQFQTMCNLLAT